MNSLKALICEKAAQQPLFKQQRKTVYFTGDRSLTPDAARSAHAANRDDLRYLYVAYALLREKDPLLANKSYNDFGSWEMKLVHDLVAQYQAEFVPSEAVHPG